MHKTLLVVLSVSALMALAYAAPYQQNLDHVRSVKDVAQAKHRQEIYDTCQRTRLSLVELEMACADVQDKYHGEYICDANNVLPTNHCTVDML